MGNSMKRRDIAHRVLGKWREGVRHARWWRFGLPHGWDADHDIQRRLVTSIRIVVDVGANRGQSALRFRRAYPDARLYCIEPEEGAYAALTSTVAGWTSVSTFKLALSSRPGNATIAGRDTMARVTLGEGPVAVETLDRWSGSVGLDRIDFLKIDTEGHDLDVLRGGVKRLASGAVGIVEVEAGMNPDNAFHAPSREFFELLEPMGYRLFGVYSQTLEWPTADAYLRRANLVFLSRGLIEENRWKGPK
jgi:FkbM family methyltransferase